MNRANPWASYRQVATQTATPGQLVLMLYDGAIRFLERANLGFAETDPVAYNHTINHNIQRAQAIIQELNSALNMEAGGDISTNFRRLYDYMDWRLQESNQQKTRAGIDDVLRRLGILRDAWAEMLSRRGEGMAPTEVGGAFVGVG